MADDRLTYSLLLSQDQREALHKSIGLLGQIFDELSSYYSKKIIFVRDYDWVVNRKIWNWLYFDTGLFGVKQRAKNTNYGQPGEKIILELTKELIYGLQIFLQMGMHTLPAIGKENLNLENQFPPLVESLLKEFDQTIKPIKYKIYSLVFEGRNST